MVVCAPGRHEQVTLPVLTLVVTVAVVVTASGAAVMVDCWVIVLVAS